LRHLEIFFLRLTLRQTLASIAVREFAMKQADKKLFQAREFAKLSGVTVRTLHHYDRLGLLKPSRYTGAGFRLYSEDDFARLEQIVALKFIGFSLNEIKNILKRGTTDLATTLRQQRQAIEEKRDRLELAVKAIESAEFVVSTSRAPGWETFAKNNRGDKYAKQYGLDKEVLFGGSTARDSETRGNDSTRGNRTGATRLGDFNQ
jgi:DNA-binding transcriptional MerR regulator